MAWLRSTEGGAQRTSRISTLNKFAQRVTNVCQSRIQFRRRKGNAQADVVVEAEEAAGNDLSVVAGRELLVQIVRSNAVRQTYAFE